MSSTQPTGVERLKTLLARVSSPLSRGLHVGLHSMSSPYSRAGYGHAVANEIEFDEKYLFSSGLPPIFMGFGNRVSMFPGAYTPGFMLSPALPAGTRNGRRSKVNCCRSLHEVRAPTGRIQDQQSVSRSTIQDQRSKISPNSGWR
jgi:hypothetical protein